MRRILLIFLFSFFLFPFLLYGTPEIYFQEEARRGEPLSIIGLSRTPIDEISAYLFTAEGKEVIHNRGFQLQNEEEMDIRVILLGIPMHIEDEELSVRVEGYSGGDHFSIDKKLKLLERDFMAENIRLGEAMSELRQSSDPRKWEEARELSALLKTFNAESIYCTEIQDLPVKDARITSDFGDRRKYIYSDGGSAHSIHTGVDLAAPRGTSVFAGGRGKVVFTGMRILTGNTVVIEHLPGVYGLYYHLDSIEVEKGQFVEKGEPIGTVGATGLVTGAHLHWEIRVAGIPVEPWWLLEKNLLDKQKIIDIISSTD
ncbi:MAG: M23 family peptidase [Spirochaetes bacterium]|nr:MAG: M23 family peptidase [Spirochaetota bacterium]